MRRVLRGLVLLVAVSLLGSWFLVPRPSVPTLDLSTPDAIEKAAFSGKLTIYMRQTDVTEESGTEFQPVKGDSIARGATGDIEISSVAFDDDHQGANNVAGPLVITKHLDRATPLFQQMVLAGWHFSNAVIVFFAAPGRVALSYSMNNVAPQGTTSKLGSDGVSETVRFSYGDIQRVYHLYNSKGLETSTITSCWSLQNNNSSDCGPVT